MMMINTAVISIIMMTINDDYDLGGDDHSVDDVTMYSLHRL